MGCIPSRHRDGAPYPSAILGLMGVGGIGVPTTAAPAKTTKGEPPVNIEDSGGGS